MIENEEFFKDVLRARNILESYYFFKAMVDEDAKNEYAQYGFKNYSSLRRMLEESCTGHIPVVLGINKNTKIYNPHNEQYTPVKFRRCVCCGKLLPFEFESEKDIDTTKYRDDLNDSYTDLNKKFFDLMDNFIDYAKIYNDREELVNTFKENVEKVHLYEEKNLRKLIIKK